MEIPWIGFLQRKNSHSESYSVDWFFLWQTVSIQDKAPSHWANTFRYNMKRIFSLLWPLGILCSLCLSTTNSQLMSFPLGTFPCDNCRVMRKMMINMFTSWFHCSHDLWVKKQASPGLKDDTKRSDNGPVYDVCAWHQPLVNANIPVFRKVACRLTALWTQETKN